MVCSDFVQTPAERNYGPRGNMQAAITPAQTFSCMHVNRHTHRCKIRFTASILPACSAHQLALNCMNSALAQPASASWYGLQGCGTLCRFLFRFMRMYFQCLDTSQHCFAAVLYCGRWHETP